MLVTPAKASYSVPETWYPDMPDTPSITRTGLGQSGPRIAISIPLSTAGIVAIFCHRAEIRTTQSQLLVCSSWPLLPLGSYVKPAHPHPAGQGDVRRPT